MNTRYSRQESYIGTIELKNQKVGVVGVGAGGSMVAELLTRMGIGTIFLFDDDIIGIHNIAGQLFCEKDIGKPKALVLARRLNMINSDVKVFANNVRIVNENQLPKDLDYLFCCVDTFKARITLINYQKRINPKCIILDGGTSEKSPTLETVQMYNREKGHITELKHFHPDLQKKLQTEEVRRCTEEIIPSLITTSTIGAAMQVHWMLQHLKDGRIYEEMCHISLGKKPVINWFKKNG